MTPFKAQYMILRRNKELSFVVGGAKIGTVKSKVNATNCHLSLWSS